ncbi:MAG: hypothetical protein HY913_13600 [Desulfomonile tiedjei]|nr:hypothetical protein [Desulfomonile tiedjei]
MPDQSQNSQQQPEDQKKAASPPPPPASRSSTVKILVSIVVLAAAFFAVYQSGLLHRFVGTQGPLGSAAELTPALNRLSPDNSISSAQLLADLGRSPVDPSKVLFPAFDKSAASDPDKKPKSCPPGSPASLAPPLGAESAVVPAPGPGTSGAKAVETPVIVSRGPGEPAPQEKPGRKKRRGETKTQEAKAEPDKEPKGGEATAVAPSGPQAGEQAKVEDGAAKQKEPAPQTAAQTKPPEPADQAKSEQFQLPGSLVVKVQNYSGTLAKWGLMVILDDSAAMGKKSKSWEPNKMGAASALVSRLPEAVTPGSRLAVRDFLCTKAEGTKKADAAPCMSHMLYDWADHPFKGLKEKLENINPGGQTNVCAAAAYAMKKDLTGLKDLAPRVLLLTSGSGKCTVKEVLHALDQRAGQGQTILDVIAFAMAKKREGTYSALAKKGRGLFLKVEKPADLDQTLARYGKTLKTKVFERIEIKGDKAVFNTALEEEITLPPGSYTITLPQVAGLAASKRTIPNVKISSGEAKVLEVQVKKGQPVLRAGKK